MINNIISIISGIIAGIFGHLIVTYIHHLRTVKKRLQKQDQLIEQKCIGYIEDTDNIHEIKNQDVYDTLSPLWQHKNELSGHTISLLYALIVTNKNLTRYNNDLLNKVQDLEMHINKLYIM
jgi:hypothetical protein